MKERKFETEDEYMEWEMSRGERAFTPEELHCYVCCTDKTCYGKCGNAAFDREVVKVVDPPRNASDPTTGYTLSCGHTII